MAAEYLTECLLVACSHEDYDWARKKLELGADPHASDSDGKTPIVYACEHGQLDFLKLLVVQYKCNVKQRYSDYRQNLVHIACKNGHLDIVQYLLQCCGCSAVAGDAFDWSPLHYACRYGHLDIVKFLVEKQKCSLEVTDKQQRVPLYYASTRGHTDIEEYLKHGCLNRKNTKHVPVHYKRPKRFVTAAFDYKGREDDELTFSVGEVIEVVGEISEDWWQGKVNGESGMFPTNYVYR